MPSPLDDYPRLLVRGPARRRRVYTADPDGAEFYLTPAAAIDAWPTTVYRATASNLYPTGIWSVRASQVRDVEPVTTAQLFGPRGRAIECAIEASRCLPYEVARTLEHTRIGTMRPTLLRLATVGAWRWVEVMITDGYGKPGPVGVPTTPIRAYQTPLTGFLVSEWLGVARWGKAWRDAWEAYYSVRLPNRVPEHFRWDWDKGERYDSRKRSGADRAKDHEGVEVDDH